jgi:tetratricopeptide (TPR) repeat protein
MNAAHIPGAGSFPVRGRGSRIARPHTLRYLLVLALCLSPSLRTTARAEQTEAWVQVRSPHFTVASNGGEKQARRVALQFEEIRAAFQTAFPGLRVDPGKPLSVIALANADSMKLFLPDYWSDENAARPVGFFVDSFDEDLAVLRLDIDRKSGNPYHSLYHEYTHAILRLNFRELPLWLGEGLSEFYGNTIVTGTDVEMGHMSSEQLDVLDRSPFIPLDVLFQIGPQSPLYTEKGNSAVFYAESWALVHYLLLDPDAAKDQRLLHYFKVLDATGDPAAAAQQAFGDLKALQEKLEQYSRQTHFHSVHLKSRLQLSDKDFSVRAMTPAEALAVRADFLQHTRHGKDALPLIRQALRLQPDSARAHNCLGYHYYVQFENEQAIKEFTEAARLDSADFRAHFYLAELNYRLHGYTATSTREITAELQHVIHLNPHFAPAYGFLAIAYLHRPETQPQALEAALKANQLEPTVLAYVADIGNAYMFLGRDDDARAIGQRLDKAARMPDDKLMARYYHKLLERHLEFAAKKRAAATGAVPVQTVEEEVPPDTPDLQPSGGPQDFSGLEPEAIAELQTVEGKIEQADCNSSPVNVSFAISGGILHFTVPDLAKIKYRIAGKPSTLAANPCSQWAGREAKLGYKSDSNGSASSEILSIDFY